jgi:hypothetical protein
MKANVGSVDRIVRVVVGAALLALFFVLDALLRYIGLVGLVPLATAAFNWCPLYTLLGINTCRTSG